MKPNSAGRVSILKSIPRPYIFVSQQIPLLHLPNQTSFYQGKVRDVYTIADRFLIMVVTDRISAFDVILPQTIPYKGQVLNQIALHFLDATRDIVPNWKLSAPLPHVTVGLRCEAYPVEMVVRGHLAGHAWRTYQAGKRTLCGVSLPDGLRELDPLPQPIITPTTKAQTGHDQDIAPDEIIAAGLVPADKYEQLAHISLALFARGREMAAARGLLLADTKYEFGHLGDTIYLIDEIHTPDSSRYYYLNDFNDQEQAGQPHRPLSKEFVREWLMTQGFQGQPGQQIPNMTADFVLEVSNRYIELFEQITGSPFQKVDISDEVLQRALHDTAAHLPPRPGIIGTL